MATLKLKGKKSKKKNCSFKHLDDCWNNKKSKDVLISFAILGLVLIALGVYIRYCNSILSFKHTSEYPQKYERIAYAKPVKLTIPSVNIETIVEEKNIVEGIWEISRNTASYLSKSAVPGQGGNIVIYGQNKENVFEPLNEVDLDEEIYLSDEEGEIHRYYIVDIQVVDSDDTEVVLPTDYEVLTVYTCTGLFDSKRLVIKASPVDFK